ncbi:ABC transporter ATP-binding protein [Nocardioides sp. zg-ZUI104]|uniref:ABC transporter ATP-binding protein n=1 Tax=Nocardioides faecalis TaxID=2803858 RepID=UPI001BCEF973|nr:ABC transporter ATP-binding protein [Nocardioides faecalis]MBS4754548.1 ABC transporter ATP-binding protein [Nocardioides faecalis]
MTGAVLSARNLRVETRERHNGVAPVRRVDLEVMPGDRLGIIGESGSGKTTAVRALIGSLAKNLTVSSGTIDLNGEPIFGDGVDRLRTIRGRSVGMVFQAPRATLNPVRTIRSQLSEMARTHVPGMTKAAAVERARELLSRMGLADPDRVLKSFPHELSGGMCQRVAIAMAVIAEPDVLIADEATSALDVTTQAEVVKLLSEVCEQTGTALIFVTHDLLLAGDVCSHLAVMYGGQIVEQGTSAAVLGAPAHPYTRALLAATPGWRPDVPPVGIPGIPPRLNLDFVGCGFRDRCTFAQDACAHEVPQRELEHQRYTCVREA